MSRYARNISTNKTPQTEKIPFSAQVPNSAGGFSFEVDDWKKLERFLILGNEGGSYYATEKKMTLQATEALLRCLAQDGLRTVAAIVGISASKRAPKNDPAIFALAVAAKKGNEVTRKSALASIASVCRTGTMFFQFVEAIEQLGGWSRATRRGVGAWYEDKTTEQLAYQLVKYRQRNSWTHRDVLRLAHPEMHRNPAIQWTLGKAVDQRLPTLIADFEILQKAESAKDVISILEQNPALPWETVPSQFMKDQKVLEALLPNMGLTAMIRQFGRMTAAGLYQPLSGSLKTALNKLGDAEQLKKQGIHPMHALIAMKVYATGHGVKGDLHWTPNQRIIDALEEVFYATFANVEPTGKRTLLALDVSGSMGFVMGGSNGLLTCREAAGAMAMVTARAEDNWHVMGFCSTFREIKITPNMRLDEICKKIYVSNFGTTDCAQPMIWAEKNKVPVDTFVVITDSETYSGAVHPVQALKAYRKSADIASKLVVMGMVASEFSIADPEDSGSLDVVGFDSATPGIIADFSRGSV